MLGQEDTLEKDMATHSSILPGKSHGQRSLVGYSPRGCKESDMTECTQYTLKNGILVNVESASTLEGPYSCDRCDPLGHLF